MCAHHERPTGLLKLVVSTEDRKQRQDGVIFNLKGEIATVFQAKIKRKSDIDFLSGNTDDWYINCVTLRELKDGARLFGGAMKSQLHVFRKLLVRFLINFFYAVCQIL